MIKRLWMVSLLSVVTSKRVVVAVVAATALVLGVMSVGAAVLVQKKITGIADVQSAPYTPPQHPGARGAREGTAPAVAAANTSATGTRAAVKKVTGTSVQKPSGVVPGSAPHPGPASVPGVPLAPGGANPAAPTILPPAIRPVIPPGSATPRPGADTNLHPLQPLRQSAEPLADLLSFSVQIQTPILGIGLGL